MGACEVRDQYGAPAPGAAPGLAEECQAEGLRQGIGEGAAAARSRRLRRACPWLVGVYL